MRTASPFGPKTSLLGQRFQLAAKRKNAGRQRPPLPHQGPKEAIGIKTVLVDISKLMELERQVLRLLLQDELSKLAGGFAHELGNLICPILVAAQNAKTHLGDEANPRAIAQLDIVVDAAKTAHRIVKEIRDYANASARSDLTGIVDPQQITHQVINLMQKTNKPDAPAVTYNLSVNTDWHIEGREHQVYQTILNLCLNACDAMTKKGQISIDINLETFQAEHKTTAGQTISAGKYVAISVSDNGLGIQPDLIKEIFNPFFTTKDPSDNTGLGLSVLLRIMALHGGGVDLISKSGQGSKFTLYFPAIEA
ncbi:MAG: HAMP domain-containing sensor histidine kinase [Candidatus Margulisiibacteriota bacterium]